MRFVDLALPADFYAYTASSRLIRLDFVLQIQSTTESMFVKDPTITLPVHIYRTIPLPATVIYATATPVDGDATEQPIYAEVVPYAPDASLLLPGSTGSAVGVPLDTTGDGKVDAMGYDTTGDGRTDTIQPLTSTVAPAPRSTARGRLGGIAAMRGGGRFSRR